MRGIRSKTLERLAKIAETDPKSPEDIVGKFNVSLATAYDYFNCLNTLKEIFTKELDEKIEELRLQILKLQHDIEQIKAKEMEREIRKILTDIDYFIEERKKRLG